MTPSRLADSAVRLMGWLLGRALRLGVGRGWIHFPFLSQALSVVPFSFGWKLRTAIYAQILPRVGKDVVVHWGAVIEDERSTFGDDVWISTGCYLDFVEIGDHVLIGPGAILLSGGRQHRSERIDVPIKLQGNNPKVALQIGDGAWVGAGAVVMAPVGKDAIVGAGSVVSRSVPPLAVVVGNPARLLRFRTAGAQEASHASGAAPASTR